MSRKRLGSIDREGVSQARDVAERRIEERRGLAASKAPPIGKVAGAAAQSIEDEMLRLRQQNETLHSETEAFTQARAAGLVVQLIALDDVEAHAVARDRRALDRDCEAWGELKSSLAARGQQTPIEISGRSSLSGKYNLISGYRRLAALKELFEETADQKFSTVKALVTGPKEKVDAMVAMIEENEIRQDISFYERGRICCLAVEQGVCETIDDAIQALFASSSRNRRYKIRNFTVVHNQLGSVLDYPEHIGERLGARLAQTLKEGRERELITALSDRETKFAEPADELALLTEFVSKSGRFDDAPLAQAAPLKAQHSGQLGLKLDAKATNGQIILKLKGVDVTSDAELAELLERIATVCSLR